MIQNKIIKAVSFLRFLLTKIWFKNSNFVNYVYSNTTFQGRKKISIGKSNIFQKYSTVIIDGYTNNQNIVIGNQNTIASFAILRSHGGYIKIGNENFIGERVQIQGRGGVEIGNRCMIGANTFISSSNHNIDDPMSESYLRKEMPVKTIIEDFVWIGANSVIVAGVTIGHHVVVGAGTIVTKDIEPYSMVVGNSGRVIKRFSFEEKKWIKLR
jgi:acetyltransferase-like isoleucine patch superfamily enzyme